MNIKSLLRTFVVALVCFAGCLATASLAQTNAIDPAPTIAYWDTLNQTFCEGQGIEMLIVPGNTDGITLSQMAEILREIATTERSRCDKVTKLPMLHVDLDLTLYAVDMVKVRLHVADLLDDFAAGVDKQSEVVSGGHIGAEFLFNVLGHLNDKDDALWNAAKDQAAQTANEIEQMKPVWNGIESDLRNAREAIGEFQAESMKVRAVLTHRYEQEFKLPSDYMKKAMAEKREFELPDLKIRELLIGQTINSGGLFDVWTFDDDREFVTFDISGRTHVNEATMAYEIKTHVKGIHSGEEHDFHMRMVIGRLATRYHVVKISRLE